MKSIIRVFKAVQDVSREVKPGTLVEKLTSGRQTNYDLKDLHLARNIYETVIADDLRHGMVTIDILKLARDPKESLINIVERKENETKILD